MQQMDGRADSPEREQLYRGVGHARKPRRYLTDGSVLQTSIDGLGSQRNRATSVR